MFKKKTSLQEFLGHLTTSTGNIILLDFGCLDLWYHSHPPSIPEWVLPNPADIELINNAVDLKINGPDAHEAGKLFDRNRHPEYIYDIPRNGVDKMQSLFSQVVKDNNLNASLNILNERITHRKRVDLALEYGKGTGEICFNGMWAIVFGNIPKNKAFSIYGERMTERKWSNRWRWVTLEVRPELETITTKHIGYVGVDEARLLFADVDSLDKFIMHDSFDGKADILFWGGDEKILAKKLKAQKLEEEVFGWQDLSLDKAIATAEKIKEIHEQSEYKFAFDYRPHSHNYYLLKQIRSSSTESGILSIGDTMLCGFMTSWGDGLFQVIGEFDKDNQLIRAKIDLGNDETVKNMKKLLG